MTEPPLAAATVEFTLHGHRIAFHLPDLTDHIQKRIAERKTFYEIELLEDMRARVSRSGLCVDVGAHLGNHTVKVVLRSAGNAEVVFDDVALYPRGRLEMRCVTRGSRSGHIASARADQPRRFESRRRAIH